MTQSVGRQQVAEFVVDLGLGNGVAGQQQKPQGDGRRGQQQQAPAGSRAEPRRAGSEAGPPGEGHRQEQRG